MNVAPTAAERQDRDRVVKDSSRKLELTGNPAPRGIRIALVDDEEGMHRLMRAIFTKHLASWQLDDYLDPRQALHDIPLFPPHAVIMDLTMPGMTGIECTRGLKTLLPELPIVMLSAHLDGEALFQAMLAGANGCLFKPLPAAEIVRALQKTMSGAMTLCPQAEKTMLHCFASLGRNFTGWQLTAREEHIMAMLCQDTTSKQIADALGITVGTVNAHVSSIYKKLGVHSRLEAIHKITSVSNSAR